MRLIKLFILFILLACEACQKNDNEICVTCQNYQEDGGNIYLTLKMDETCIMPTINKKMTISFVEVVDGRCPMGACEVCCFSSASILLSISESKRAKIDIDLGIWGCMYEVIDDPNNYVDTLGYRFSLIRLSPYPDVDPINKNDYTAKIKITKL